MRIYRLDLDHAGAGAEDTEARGRRSGVVVAVAAAVMWIAADVGQLGVEHIAPSAWNGLTRLIIFVGAAVLIADRRTNAIALEAKVARAVREREAARELALTDPLTGLYNRAFLLEESKRLQGAVFRPASPYSVIAIDVDGLKLVNDRFGHAAGDRVLKEVGAAIRSVVRRADLPIRTGGDEFVVLLPDATEAEAGKIASRVRAALTGRPVVEGAGSISIGVATWRSHTSMHDLLLEADHLMYEDKARARRTAPTRTADTAAPR